MGKGTPSTNIKNLGFIREKKGSGRGIDKLPSKRGGLTSRTLKI